MSILLLLVGLGGCALMAAALIAVVWVILNERKNTEKNQREREEIEGRHSAR